VASQILERTRTINKALQAIGGTNVSFDQLSNVLGDVLNSNIYILSSKGKVLGLYLFHEKSSALVADPETHEKKFPLEYTANAMKLNETLDNLTGDELLKVFPNDISGYDKYTTVIPILGSGQRLGTVVLARFDEKFSDEDLVLAEYSATIVGLEILRAKGEELEDEMRKKAVVQMAIGTLSYSELEAVEHIFEELNGKEGLLVASKIADRVGITRSVIVNALRKFESAGVIESRSLGMKGTHIRVLNDKLMDELKKLKNNR
jgi:transcriptional pleiotropic repressor